jgi:hypothetical protein
MAKDVLKFASENLKNDKDIALAAVKDNGHALRYASDDLKKDKDVVKAALFGTDAEIINLIEKEQKLSGNDMFVLGKKLIEIQRSERYENFKILSKPDKVAFLLASVKEK